MTIVSSISPQSALALLLAVVEYHESVVYQAQVQQHHNPSYSLKYPFAGGTISEATSNASSRRIVVQNATQRRHLPLNKLSA
mmetsp:Transcript_6617/g.11137  ORF Transcript_6617/g.11137 Transcript_6617/m.11137 type:complete len:82 (+) Transcript_6617:422-667(+)